MSEETVNIEVDGRPLQASKGQMLIDATDAAGIYIPRFCYHKKLTVVANCRMCLVEVERAPKPQPACATPVMEGMKVFTKSEKAVSGQQATMEFLLINHPLDCPICDQGGECELQDLAVGYGSDISQYAERKRVVRDKNIGPLVQTDMTRCIHCTRCVRFGEEVAGLRELGATGRGEHMEIGTYVEQAMTSELSGNVIDLCPVGALTSKPYRYSARAWELQQRPTIAPHDCVGSNLNAHLKGQVVKRVVPRENEAINETWISDRDRFSYQGLRHEQRLLAPRVKENGVWRECDWESAFKAACAGLAAHGESLGALAAPSSTNEEFFLLQRLARGLGSSNVDHRLRQQDFSADDLEPLAPGLDFTLVDLSHADAVLVVGGYPRHDQPLLHHRIRQAALRGAQVLVLDALAEDYNFDLAERIQSQPQGYAAALGAIVRAAAEAGGNLETINTLQGCVVHDQHRRYAATLAGASRSVIVVANEIGRHSARGQLLALVNTLATLTDSRLGCLTEGANSAGAWLAGAVPHRGPGGARVAQPGATALGQWATPLSAYLVLGFEPDADLAQPALAGAALAQAQCVVALSAYVTPTLESLASVLLPIALHAENEGSFVNANGAWQTFNSVAKPPGDARPAWKILRVLGEQLGLDGFDAVTCADVSQELAEIAADLPVGAPCERLLTAPLAPHTAALEILISVPMYSVDPLVRRAAALQQMPQHTQEWARLAAATCARLGLVDGAAVSLAVTGHRVNAVVLVDEHLPEDVVGVHAASHLASHLVNGARCELALAAVALPA